MSTKQAVYSSVQIVLQNAQDSGQQHMAAVIYRQIESRCAAKVVAQGGEFVIAFTLMSSMKPESYAITSPSDSKVVIQAADQLGFYYGVGRFLHDSAYPTEGFAPGAWTGLSEPDKPVRGMYLATHFHNYYHDAPIEEINEYLEDLALWGTNTVMVWYDMHHYRSIDDADAQAMIKRLRTILGGVKSLGLRIALVCLGNEAYNNDLKHLHANFNTGRATYKCELCPNKPEAMAMMLKWFSEAMDAFSDLDIDLLNFGPYDQGGCACEACRPWGCNGYLKICEAKARIARQKLPNVKICLSTWLFDYAKDEGEWAGLDKAFADGVDWCDYIQADSHETYPKYPLEHGVPGNLKLLNFPEISMWMMHPWGGFGANPLPARFETLWHTVKDKASGGFPYSEGIYEDINKVLTAQFYWSRERTAQSILKDYIAFEFSPEVVDNVLKAINIFEANHNHIWSMNWILKRQSRFEIFFKEDPDTAFALLEKADAKLTPQARKRWRWRIVYLRGLIDQQLAPTQGYWANETCEKAFHELTDIFHAHKAEVKCAPPTRESVKAMRASESLVSH